LVAADIPAALDLWQNTEGVGLTIEATPEMLVSFLERNPSISSAAFLEGRLVGAVLGGHDGRRGYLYHLSVATEHRRQGLARSLVDRTPVNLERSDCCGRHSWFTPPIMMVSPCGGIWAGVCVLI
jgi:ribosomal protein S18 acetylase RimI-like enzyme